ncbi:MAG: hypothetical protein JJU12_01935 [Chlamydiales bacterium]|nr:hypothetical protein [Chlamydiales bacterium]
MANQTYSLGRFIDANHAWGYLSPPDLGAIGKDKFFRNCIYLHNGLNAGSIVLSPLAGFIRIITAVFFLFMMRNINQSSTALFDVDATKRFLKMQAGRGVMELSCLGPILGTVVDGFVTCRRDNLFW